MEQDNTICLNVWIDQSVSHSEWDESVINHLDANHIVLFRVSILDLDKRMEVYESKLRDLKFDGRIRVILSVEEPQYYLRTLKATPFLRLVPFMVNSASIKKSEDSTTELRRMKGDIIISSKLADFYKFCRFATLLWINYIADTRRSIMEKKVLKTGVVMIRTESVETGLRYLETHPHLGILDEFRIIIGDGKIVDEPDSVAVDRSNLSRNRTFSRPTAVSIIPVRRKLYGREELATIELVEILRNRLKWQAPILVFYYDYIENQNVDIYQYQNIKLTDEHTTAEYFALMNALPWVYDQSPGYVDINKGGVLKIVGIQCNGIVPKNKNGTSDPFAIVKVGKEVKKTKKINNTLNPRWNVNWDISCKLSDPISVSIWDWDLFGRNNFEGQVNFSSLNQLIPYPMPILEVTKPLCPKGKLQVKGTINFELGFQCNEESSSKRKHFGQPLEESFKNALLDNVPHITETIIDILWVKGLKTSGIFKEVKSPESVRKLIEMVDSTKPFNMDDEHPTDIAQLLKIYLRDLPDALIPNAFYKSFKKVKSIEKRKGQIKHIRELISTLPDENQKIFKDLSRLLNEISKYYEANGMSTQSLSRCMAPSMIIPRESSMNPHTLLKDTLIVSEILEMILVQYDKIFSPVKKMGINKTDISPNKVEDMNALDKRDHISLRYDYVLGSALAAIEESPDIYMVRNTSAFNSPRDAPTKIMEPKSPSKSKKKKKRLKN